MSHTAKADPPEAESPRYRSGAAAHMTGIAVSTLRIWERRYRVVAPPQTASGHRLYSTHDVQRLALLKQLVDRGHAISTVAQLDLDDLHEVAATHARSRATATTPQAAPLAVVVVGFALARRLRDGPLARAAATTGLSLVAERADLADAEASSDELPQHADLLLVHAPTLQPESASVILALAQRLSASRVLVLYGFGPARAIETLRAAGVLMRRAPLSNSELVAQLDDISRTVVRLDPAASAPPRRFDDASLTTVANASPTMACECPRHLAELLILLANFETYSAECANRGPDDAALHAYLHQVAGNARAQFEAALERVARVEGLTLPA